MDIREKIVSTKEIFNGRIFNVKVHDVVLPDGEAAKREIVTHHGGVGVIAVTPEREVFMVTQYRIATGDMLLEIPAGKLEKNENDTYAAAMRELEEETGYRTNKLIPLGTYYVSPGYCSEPLTIYLAENLEYVGQHLDDDEFLNLSKIPLDKLYEMVMNNEIRDCKTAIAILKAKIILG